MKSTARRLFGEEFNNLLFMNLISAVLCLPVITAGPAILAMKGVLMKVMGGTCGLNRLGEYFQLWKRKFLRGLLFELLAGAYVFLLLYSYSLSDVLKSGGRFVAVLCIGMGFAAAVVSCWIVTLLAGTDLPFGEALWQGVLMSLAYLPRSLAAAGCVYGILLTVYLLYPLSLVPLAVILLAVASVLSLVFLWEPFAAHYPEQKNESERSLE